MKATHRSLALGLALALLLATAAWWWWPGRRAPAPAAAAGPPPVSVSTVRAERRDVPVQLEATGTVTPLNTVDVRPQVASVVRSVNVREGQFVRSGELLFTLDDRAEQAALARSLAQRGQNQATLANAERQLARSRELLAQKFIAQAAVDTNLAAVETARAAVAADQAAIRSAQVALGYARIAAPLGGRIGVIAVHPGSTVQPGGSVMLTITQLDPIAVAFNLPQRHLDDALARLGAGGADVSASLPEGRGALAGKLQFVDNGVDPATGTVRVKAVFENREQKLWPGAFVNVRFGVQTLKDAVVIPQAAVIQGLDDRSVYVVDDAGRAALRKIRVLQTEGPVAVVEGVQAGERVVMEGRQNLRPGQRVAERGNGAAPAASAASAVARGSGAGRRSGNGSAPSP